MGATTRPQTLNFIVEPDTTVDGFLAQSRYIVPEAIFTA